MIANDDACALNGRLERSQRIAQLNDLFRRQLRGGKLFVTPGVIRKCRHELDGLLRAIRCFDDFTRDNDPYGEHDFGAVQWGGVRVFWKIDYCDASLAAGSPDASDPTVTVRALTVMLASEY